MKITLINNSVLVLLAAGLCACNTGNVIPAQETSLAQVSATELNASQAYEKEDWVTAEREYRKLTEIMPTSPESWFRLGNVYVRLKRPNDALLAYQEALIRDPNHAKAWHNTGIVQLEQATNTFLEMQNHLQSDDPLYQRAQQIIDSVTGLLEQDFEKPQ